ncbi:hypothetical protein CoNPh26_CDS0061 [Staphylococcus phage S-CoN_Ph26]|nr:hypothetical protein CoNPh26_CDS0061 [Staphylococcus phage S-CoN_Ph26]
MLNQNIQLNLIKIYFYLSQVETQIIKNGQ